MAYVAPCIVCALLGCIAFLFALFIIQRRRADRWESFDRIAKRIVREIRGDRFHPDVIISLGHFGLVLGGVCRSNFSSRHNHPAKEDGDFPVPLLFGFHKNFALNARDEDNRLVLIPSLVEMVRDSRVLLVAGDVSSGEGARRLRDWMLEAGAREVRLAALSMHPSANAPFDYIGEIAENPATRPWVYSQATSSSKEATTQESSRRSASSRGSSSHGKPRHGRRRHHHRNGSSSRSQRNK